MEDMELDFAQGLDRVEQVIQSAQKRFVNLLSEFAGEGLDADEVLRRERHVRYLSVQYHLMREIQRRIFRIAAHPELSLRRDLRDFLVAKAGAEEFRFQDAADGVIGRDWSLVPAPLDVQLWHAHFDLQAETRPFLWLGTCCVLERIENEGVQEFRAMFGELPFHAAYFKRAGRSLFQFLGKIEFDARQYQDLEEGAIHAATMYLRMLHWALHGIAV